MKSAQINRYGGSEVIEINQNTPEPTLSSGKALVSIKSAGVIQQIGKFVKELSNK
jgi:hypothetical protein